MRLKIRFCRLSKLISLFMTLSFSFMMVNVFFFSTEIRCSTSNSCVDCEKVALSNRTMNLSGNESLCSVRATRRAGKQKVIGVSAFLSRTDNPKLIENLRQYLFEYFSEAEKFYPTWIVRVYHFSLNISNDEIEQIEKRFKNVDFCDSTNIPSFGNIVDWFPGKMQRFLPVIDPLVDVFMSRDVDSPILEREKTVVDLWMNSKKTINFIRDHPQHTVPILGGLWGIKLKEESVWRTKISQIFYSKQFVRCYTGKLDQNFLEQHLWPYALSNFDRVLAFDSFFCRHFQRSQPFPTEKLSPTLFVGCRRPNCTTDQHRQCPKFCRPVEHQDWIYC